MSEPLRDDIAEKGRGVEEGVEGGISGMFHLISFDYLIIEI